MKVENAKDMADVLVLALGEYMYTEEEIDDLSVHSFMEEGVLTRNEGFVARLRSGDTFQVTVVKSR